MSYQYNLYTKDGSFVGRCTAKNPQEAANSMMALRLAVVGKAVNSSIVLEPVNETTYDVLYGEEAFILKVEDTNSR